MVPYEGAQNALASITFDQKDGPLRRSLECFNYFVGNIKPCGVQEGEIIRDRGEWGVGQEEEEEEEGGDFKFCFFPVNSLILFL